MPGPARRRIDLSRMPAVGRYALAIAVVAVVVGLALWTRGEDAPAEAAGWYTVIVRVGAVLLLAYGGFWLARHLLRARHRR